MDRRFLESLDEQVEQIREGGLYKEERIITSPQGAAITVRPRDEVLNFCANNYLGLSDHPAVVKAAHEALDRWGYGMSSVRFICGTQDIHKELEDRLTRFLGTEDTILYGSCFDANGGLFETILGEEDAVFSDALNHRASPARSRARPARDGIRPWSSRPGSASRSKRACRVDRSRTRADRAPRWTWPR